MGLQEVLQSIERWAFMCWAYDLKKPASILMAGDDAGRRQSLDVAGCMSMVLQSIER